MDSSNKQTPDERILAEVMRLPWTKGLDEQAIVEIIEASEPMELSEGEIVHRAGDTMTAVYFVTQGRLWATVLDLFGKKVMERPMVRGTCLGLFAVAQPEDFRVDVKTMEPTSLLKLSFDELLRLTAKYRQFQMNIYRLASDVVRQLVNVDRKRDQPMTVALVHQSEATRSLTPKLIQRLREIGETPCAVSDDPNWKPMDGVPFRPLIENGQIITREEGSRQLKEWSKMGRIFADVSGEQSVDDLSRSMGFADAVLWCVTPECADKARAMLAQLQDRVAGWRDKICLVWLLPENEYVAPYDPDLTSMVDRVFKMSFSPPQKNQGNLLHVGMERIVHFLRGVRIGIALGGGAARGMAHLGVLKVLEQNGIHIDMIAGTSAGAMTGTLYSYGMEVDYNVDCYCKDLRLPWLFRKLPGGGYWYLLYKYRRGQFDPMLRKYAGDARLEQLAIPTYTVTVDLVSGGPVVRETGDAVRSITESINVPGLSSPILGETEALVDGGLVNNVPADILVGKGCNFVIASTVTAQLEQVFSGIGADGDSGNRKKPSTLQVLMRGQMVQSRNMNSVGVQPADFVIAPDVTMFDASEFGRTDELAAVGEQTAKEAVAGLKKLLSRLDNQLFPES